MRSYIIRRLLLTIPTVLIVTLIVFFMIRLIPGDVIDIMAAGLISQGINVELARSMLTQRLGLDVPVIVQYGRWLGIVPGADGKFRGLFQGSLGDSLWRSDTVIQQIATRWPVTLELGFLGLLISQLIAIPIGIYSALRHDSLGDYIARSFAILAIAVPGFWIATLIIVFPAIWWGYMPPILYVPLLEDPLRNLKMFIVPATILGLDMAGSTMRMARTMMLEVMRQDYIRTAWSKGLRERVVIFRHALKNALISVVTMIGLYLPVLIGGTVIIENIFDLPGMGALILHATAFRDYPVVSGTMLLFGAGTVLINLMVDLTYAYLDPRIHYR
jgi:peptide/nickel transport system permease protein